MPANLGEQMQQLYQQFGHINGATIELHKELLALRIDNRQASATLFLQGAQLSHYQRHGEAALIWLSDHCEYKAGQPLRGGIPVCWPWFGDLQHNPAPVQQQLTADHPPMPAHGLVRHRDWQLCAIDNLDSDTTRVTLELHHLAGDNPHWPFACHLQLSITIGARLELQFSVTNNSATTLHYAAALHSYFAVSDIAGVSVTGLEQMPYVDCLAQWQSCQQQGPLLIDREIDRIYHTAGQPLNIIDGGQRTLTLTTTGSRSSIIWNPWVEKSQRLSQFGEQDYQHMLCIETANAHDDHIRLAAGQQHQLKLTIAPAH